MSTDDRRIKRPKADRTSARRSLSTLFVPPAALPSSSPAGAGAWPSGTAAEPWTDVIARSVDLGYQVLDDYVRQGERVARTVNERGPAAGPMAAFVDTQDAARRMAQYAMDFTTLWLQMVQGAQSAPAWPFPPFPGFATPPVAAWPGAPSSDGAAARPSPPPTQANGQKPVRVTVLISSAKPAEVAVDLRPEAGACRMVVQSLRSPWHGPPRLSDVALTGDGVEDPFTLRIRIPDDQPAGVYNGIVIEEESGLPLGTVSVRVKSE